MAVVGKRISQLLDTETKTEGSGGQIRRSIGTAQVRHLDPFLLLDHFSLAPPHTFPDHPHRGFEALTYILSGRILYENSLNQGGEMQPGDAQLLVTGRGVLHAAAATGSQMEGITVWINQHSSTKMCEPYTKDAAAADIPKVQFPGVVIEVLSGNLGSVIGPCGTQAPTQILIIRIDPGASLSLESPEEANAFIYLIQGEVSIQGQTLTHSQAAVLENIGNAAIFSSGTGAFFVFLQGRRIGEPIFQHGPFVMTKRDEVLAAQVDFNHHQNGFENAHLWHSKIVPNTST